MSDQYDYEREYRAGERQVRAAGLFLAATVVIALGLLAHAWFAPAPIVIEQPHAAQAVQHVI